MVFVSSTPFAGQDPANVFNASGVAPVGSARFIFVDNRKPRALFELNLNPDGSQHGPLVPRRIVGPAAGALSDPEGLARIDAGGEIDLIMASSLSGWRNLAGNVGVNDGLVRVRYAPDGDLHAQAMPGFRDWLITHYPEFTEAADLQPDAGGLNIEGLAWDPSRNALLFGFRSPVEDGQIPVLCIPLDLDAPWDTAALQAGPVLVIDKPDFAVPQGIRDIDYDAERQEFLVVVGRSRSGGAVPFQLCTWDGASSAVDILDVTFEPHVMKPEGVTAFPGGGARKILIVDDAGGFATVSV